MGRSVGVPSNAIAVAYQTADDMGSFDDWEWDMFTDNVTEQFLEMSPSAYRHQEWAGNEDRVLAENGLVQFGVSTYCGLVAIWLIPAYEDTEALAINWANQIGERFQDAFSELRRMGVMSSGEAAYERV